MEFLCFLLSLLAFIIMNLKNGEFKKLGLQLLQLVLFYGFLIEMQLKTLERKKDI